MALTDDNRMQMALMAVMRHNVITVEKDIGGHPEPQPNAWVRPVDWIDIANEPVGTIAMVVADTSFAVYAFICSTDSGDYQIDWGDGTVATYASLATAQHSYVTGAGAPCSRGYTTFKVVISAVSGNLLSFGVAPTTLPWKQQFDILEVVCKATSLTTLTSAFYKSSAPQIYCRKLEAFSISNVAPNLTVTSSMFSNCRSLQYVNTTGFTAVTNAYGMFSSCIMLESINLTAFTSVTDASFMFDSCNALIKINISALISVQNVNNMFSGCSRLCNITVGNLPLVTNATSMFNACVSLEDVDISGLIGLLTATSMFNGCSSLKTIKLSTSIVTANSMFSGCQSLSIINISTLINLQSAISMFAYCYSLYRVTLGSLPSLVNATSMFSTCRALTNIDVSGLTAVQTGTSMFTQCLSLIDIDISGMSALQNATTMFSSCDGLQTVKLPTSIITAISMFSECSSLQSIDLTGLINLQIATSMFQSCHSIKSINMSGLINVAIAQSMFRYCYGLENIDISSMTATTDFSQMFTECRNLKSVVMDNLIGAVDMSNMFYYCSSLLTLQALNLINLANVSQMFRYCTGLQSVNLSGGLQKLTSADALFDSCVSLSSVLIPDFGTNAVSTSLSVTFVSCKHLHEINVPNAKLTYFTARGVSVSDRNGLQVLVFHPASPFSGSGYHIDIRWNDITAEQLNAIFTSLPVLAGKTINITGCTGAPTCTRSIATAKGWTVTGW